MKRDMDYVRDLLLRIEELTEPNLADLALQEADEDEAQKLAYHIRMMIEEVGLVRGIEAGSHSGTNWLNINLTWQGHEYLDDVRDPEVWKQAKAGAEKFGGLSFELFGALAKGLVKQQIKKRTGVDIEL